MKKYIGTKIIHAEECPAWEKRGEHEAGTPGYKVVYEDGYTSWSPREAFENAYRETVDMTFGLAIEAIKKGYKVAKSGWCTDVFLELQNPDEHSKMTHPYIYVTSRFGLVPWVATQVEILSEDWLIVE